MDKDTQNLKIENSSKAGIVHVLLSRSYAVYFFAVVLGAFLDEVFHFDIFKNNLYQYVGIVMIIVGTIFIYWAQKTTNTPKSELKKERDTNFFIRGPYRYTRNPTNLGVAIMTLGLGFLINSLLSVIFIIAAYLISKFIFIKKQDYILEERYGSVFNEYKKKVKNWL
jgi:protein-S-isoprenylcysteine O-methyltransferase Ste14